jgi:hypothetical protein
MVLVMAGNALAYEWIVESRSGGKNYSSYADNTTAGGWGNSSVKSTAAGCTSGIGCRYSNSTACQATFSFKARASGNWDVYSTWPSSTNGDTVVLHTVSNDGTALAVNMNQVQSAGGNHKWNLVGTVPLTAGNTYTVVMTNPTLDGPAALPRAMADAVKWVKTDGCVAVADVSITTPLQVGATTVAVTGVTSGATLVNVYADGNLIGSGAPSGTTATVTTSALVAGTRLWATQTVGGVEGCVITWEGPLVGTCDNVPAVTIGGVLLAGDTTVPVTGVSTTASLVKVYSNGVAIGSMAPGGATSVSVPVTALATGVTITATQFLGTLEGCLPTTGPAVGACNQIPTVAIAGLTDAGRTSLLVTGVSSAATLVKVYANDGTTDNLIGSATATAGATTVPVTALVEGQTVKATQFIRMEGCIPTSGQRVMAAGVVEDFNGTIAIADSPDAIAGGAYRTWYDVSTLAWSDVVSTGTRATLFGSKCLNILDSGWTNGAYAIFEKAIPATGTYYLVVDMLIDEPEGVDPNVYRSYQVGVKVGADAVHRGAADLLGAITSPAGSYPCLTSGRDGTDNTEAVKVYVTSFTANAGDDLLVAFTTDLSDYVVSYTSTAGQAGMKIDNIRLVAGDKPSQCTDVAAPTILPTSVSSLEAGGTIVTLASVDALASLVTVYADGTAIGSMVPGGASQVDVGVTALVAGQSITASQTKSGVESCSCPGVTGFVVGTGDNSAVTISLGIRETGNNCGSVGCDGGVTGNIEWIGASSYAAATGPVGKALGTGVDWQTITFSSSVSGGTDPVTAFPAGTSNGVIDGTYGTLEDISIATKGTNTGRYVLYIDEIYNGDTLVTGFESPIAVGDLAMFRLPNNSGTTSGNLLAYPNIAEVDGSKAAAGTQSYRFEFQFKDNDPKRWVRLTTVDDTTSTDMPVQNPMIDLTKPITMKVMLYGAPACGLVFADRDADGDVDMVDFAMFQRCLTTGGGTYATECVCLDHNFNGTIDENDLTSFAACASGANVPATPGCGN